MEISSPAMDEQSILEPTDSLAETDPPTNQTAGSPLDEPADDSDLRALDVTAGEPD